MEKRRNTWNKYMYDGVVYDSLLQLAKKYDIDYTKLQRRLKRGFTLEQALDVDFSRKYGYTSKRNPIKYRGVDYSGLTSLAKAYDVPYHILYYRLESGYSIDGALNYDNLNKIEFRGKVYKSKTHLAKEFNLNPSMLVGRLNLGWSMEQALGLEKPPTGLTYRGNNYKSLRLLCETRGKNYTTVQARLNLGWSLSQALGDEPRKNKVENFNDTDLKRGAGGKMHTKRTKTRTRYVIEGREFKNKKEVADFYGINYQTFVSRLNKGFSVIQAIDKDFTRKYGNKRGRRRKS